MVSCCHLTTPHRTSCLWSTQTHKAYQHTLNWRTDSTRFPPAARGLRLCSGLSACHTTSHHMHTTTDLPDWHKRCGAGRNSMLQCDMLGPVSSGWFTHVPTQHPPPPTVPAATYSNFRGTLELERIPVATVAAGHGLQVRPGAWTHPKLPSQYILVCVCPWGLTGDLIMEWATHNLSVLCCCAECVVPAAVCTVAARAAWCCGSWSQLLPPHTPCCTATSASACTPTCVPRLSPCPPNPAATAPRVGMVQNPHPVVASLCTQP